MRSEVWRPLFDLALPGTCAACGAWSTPVLCPACTDELCRQVGSTAAVRHTPTPAPAGMPPCWSTAEYASVVRRLVVAHKDADRRDLRAVLAALLTPAVGRALAEAPRGADVLVVPVPSSARAWRVRGDHPWRHVAGAAADDHGLPVADVVRVSRVRDQAGLDAGQRRANLTHAMAVRAGHEQTLADRHVIVVDDVVTTGATLAETARVVLSCGAASVRAATVAATQRRGGPRRWRR